MKLCRWTVEVYLQQLFIRIGHLIGTYPLSIIAALLSFTLLCSCGMLRFEESDNVRTEYSPSSSPSRREYEVAKSFMKENGSIDPCYVMIQAADGGSLLRDAHRWQVYNLTKNLMTDVNIVENNIAYRYLDICAPYCDMNAPFFALMRWLNAKPNDTVTYPKTTMFGSNVFIGNHIYGIKLKNNATMMVNDSSNEIDHFSTIILSFYMIYNGTDEGQTFVVDWQLAARKYFTKREYNLLKCEITSDNLASVEIRRMSTEVAPLFLCSIITMFIFVVAFSFRRNKIRSKPWEAIVGCIVPLLSLITTIGVLSAIGLKFQSIVVASLFLVLAVGVDDVFIIMRAWDHADVQLTIPDRMSATLQDAGPSITISSLTNALSFAIGITSSTPAVQTFCIYSMLAVVVCYFYQLLLFSAVLALSGRRERAGRQAFMCCFKANPDSICTPVTLLSPLHDGLIDRWSRCISTWKARIILAVIMIVYYIVSYYGIIKLSPNITIEKITPPDSYFHEFQQNYEIALRSMQPIWIFVMRPGNLSDVYQLNRLRSLVSRYENATYSYGAESTFFWLRPYEEFLRFYNFDEFTYTELPTFLKSASYAYFDRMIHLNNSACYANIPTCITNFMLMTSYHDIVKYHEMIPAVHEWRAIAKEYAEFDVYPYDVKMPFVDQTIAIEQTIFGNVIAALICTAFACMLFIPNVISICVAVGSVLSISVGIFGLLSHWGIDLDPLSMAALLMAIGFSVDYTAHMSFHYYKSDEANPVDRLRATLLTISWPMFQVGTSTIICMLPTLINSSYLAVVFVKTVVVVVVLGTIHGLVVLPAILTALPCFDRSSSSNKITPVIVINKIDENSIISSKIYLNNGVDKSLSIFAVNGDNKSIEHSTPIHPSTA